LFPISNSSTTISSLLLVSLPKRPQVPQRKIKTDFRPFLRLMAGPPNHRVGGGKDKKALQQHVEPPDDWTVDATESATEDSSLEIDHSEVDDCMEISAQEEGDNTEGEGADHVAAHLAATVVSHNADDHFVDIDDDEEDGDEPADSQGIPVLGKVPAPKHTSGSIPRTRFADEYRSTLTREAGIHAPGLLPLLAHVNCGFLSTHGLAPTLTELKQHAQSLIVLIKALTISTNSAFVDNRNLQHQMSDATAFHDGETYDFLNDLNMHYDGPQAPELLTHHSLPLNAALNTVETAQVIQTQTACACAASKQAPISATGGGKQDPNPSASGQGLPAHEILRDICPLHSSYYTPINGSSLPYAQHQALISHANEVLELLDHEYSAKGGLLSIFPPKEQVEDRKKAETTLLGQLILYMQRLVQRVHDLERLYANAMDALASEAVVPLQTLSRLGPDGRKGRELVYPQDRFVLVNAGEDLFSFLSHEFDKKDIADEVTMQNNKKYGVTGEAIWKQRGGREFSRGITAIDVTTRYFRLRGDTKEGRGIKTIFIIPAHAEHPGVSVTREMEKQPTVVSVVKPVWPERQSIWEMKHRSDLQDLKVLKRENQNLKSEKAIDDNAKMLLQYELDLKKGEIWKLKKEVATKDAIINKPGEEVKAELLKTYVADANKAVEAADQIRAANEADRVATIAARAEADRLRDQLRRQTAEYEKNLVARIAREKEERAARLQKLKHADEENARVATELEEKLKAAWEKQIQETQVIIEYLKSKKVDVGKQTVPENVVDLGNENGEHVFNAALGGTGSGGEVLGTDHGHGGPTFLYPGANTDPEAMSEDASRLSYGMESDDQSMYDCCP
jgi:hypothetical protein